MNTYIRSIAFSCITIASLFSMQIAAADAVKSAKAVLSPTRGNTVSGVVSFTQVSNGIKIVADVNGLTPGEHGFHVHEFGDCSAPDAMSAGAHFNPSHQTHGAPDASHHHSGDLGNIKADASGSAHYVLIDNSISFAGANSILGRSMIVHVDKDDLHSQPVGNAGPRVACGVIGVAQ